MKELSDWGAAAGAIGKVIDVLRRLQEGAGGKQAQELAAAVESAAQAHQFALAAKEQVLALLEENRALKEKIREMEAFDAEKERFHLYTLSQGRAPTSHKTPQRR